MCIINLQTTRVCGYNPFYIAGALEGQVHRKSVSKISIFVVFSEKSSCYKILNNMFASLNTKIIVSIV